MIELYPHQNNLLLRYSWSDVPDERKKLFLVDNRVFIFIEQIEKLSDIQPLLLSHFHNLFNSSRCDVSRWPVVYLKEKNSKLV